MASNWSGVMPRRAEDADFAGFGGGGAERDRTADLLIANRGKLVPDATTAQPALLARCARGVSGRNHSQLRPSAP